MAEQDFEFISRPYMLFFARKGNLSIAAYEKGPKVVMQGKGTEDFVKFELEPKITGEARLGYEEVLQPAMFEPHFGIDDGDGFLERIGHALTALEIGALVGSEIVPAGLLGAKRGRTIDLGQAVDMHELDPDALSAFEHGHRRRGARDQSWVIGCENVRLVIDVVQPSPTAVDSNVSASMLTCVNVASVSVPVRFVVVDVRVR